MTRKYTLHPFFNEQEKPLEKRCDHAGCLEEGLYRAPKSPESLNLYYWFCLVHVRAYNAEWNYYAGRNTHEVEYLNREDMTWQRPTWHFGLDPYQRYLKFCFRDTHDILGWGKDFSAFDKEPDDQNIALPLSEESKAMILMGIKPPVTIKEVKNRYLELVKKYHPDRNGGCTIAEEKLKAINLAFDVLKKFLKT